MIDRAFWDHSSSLSFSHVHMLWLVIATTINSCLYTQLSLIAGLVLSTNHSQEYLTGHTTQNKRSWTELRSYIRPTIYFIVLILTRFILAKLSKLFYILIAAHVLFLMVVTASILITTNSTSLRQAFHLIGNYLPDMLVTIWGVSKEASGGLASLTVLLPAVAAPLVGLTVDSFGCRVHLCVFAGVSEM